VGRLFKPQPVERMADFLQPGCDGTLPAGVNEWSRGLVYTARPEIPHRLRNGQEYRITVAYKRRAGVNEASAGYGDLYRRVSFIARARIGQLMCSTADEPPHAWVMCHGWRPLGDTHNIVAAFLTMGLVCLPEGDPKPLGEKAPTAEELLRPGGTTLEILTRFAPQRVDEIYNEFDFTDPSNPDNDPMILSYGESVQTCEAIDFQPFVRRAEALAKFYWDVLGTLPGGSKGAGFEILRRNWYCITNPNLVTVEVHFAA
jgi:hypothetical protein